MSTTGLFGCKHSLYLGYAAVFTILGPSETQSFQYSRNWNAFTTKLRLAESHERKANHCSVFKHLISSLTCKHICLIPSIKDLDHGGSRTSFNIWHGQRRSDLNPCGWDEMDRRAFDWVCRMVSIQIRLKIMWTQWNLGNSTFLCSWNYVTLQFPKVSHEA